MLKCCVCIKVCVLRCVLRCLGVGSVGGFGLRVLSFVLDVLRLDVYRLNGTYRWKS